VQGKKIFEKVRENRLQEVTLMLKEIATSMDEPMAKFGDATRKLLSLQTEFWRLSTKPVKDRLTMRKMNEKTS
jgi:hypothetical protein